MTSLTLRVERIDALTPNVRRLLLTNSNGNPLPDFTPGAHVELQIPGERCQHRAYSLVNLPGSGHYEIAVQLEESGSGGSRWVHGLQVNAEITVEAPKNHFSLMSTADDHLLIAGGIGITPILGMARSLREADRPFTVHYAGRDPRRMAYLEEVQALPGASCWISGGEHGQRMPLMQILADPSPGRHLYVCGPKGLIANVLESASDLGWAAHQLHSELFAGSLGSGLESSFEVELRNSGVTLQVPAGKSLLEVMLEANLDPMFDCRRGDCGVCVAQVLEGEAEHRDICLSERERASGSFCTCVSRASGTRLVLDL